MSSAPGVSGGPEDGWAAIRKAARHPQGLGGWVAGFVLSLLETVLSSGDLPGWVTCGHRMSSAGQPCEREAGCTGDGKRGATGVGDLSRAGWKVGRRNEGHCLLVLGQWLCPGCGVSRAERTV